MIIASSGLPNIGVGPAFSAFPPEIKALFQCDPKTCIALHKQGKNDGVKDKTNMLDFQYFMSFQLSC